MNVHFQASCHSRKFNFKKDNFKKFQREKRQFQKNMGRIYLEHLGGSKLFVCAECDTFLSNNNELFSKNTRGHKESAFLFKKVVNVTFNKSTEKTYQHFVKEVFCKKCTTKLGVFYEFVPNESIRYLEGKIILEKSAVRQENGIEEHKRKSKSSAEDKLEQEYREPEVFESDSESDSEDEESDRDETG